MNCESISVYIYLKSYFKMNKKKAKVLVIGKS